MQPAYLERWLNLKQLYSDVLDRPKIFFKAALDECHIAYAQPLVGVAWVQALAGLLRALAPRTTALLASVVHVKVRAHVPAYVCLHACSLCCRSPVCRAPAMACQ